MLTLRNQNSGSKSQCSREQSSATKTIECLLFITVQYKSMRLLSKNNQRDTRLHKANEPNEVDYWVILNVSIENQNISVDSDERVSRICRVHLRE